MKGKCSEAPAKASLGALVSDARPINPPTRRAGVMLPLASLPSAHGVGDMGEAAYRLIELLAQSHVRYWQILPINPLGYGNSPYQPYSSFAGDPLFISVDRLRAQGLLEKAPPFSPDAEHIDYAAARAHKEALLRQAFVAFVPDAAYEAFAAQRWVYRYAVFMAFKRENNMRAWNEWPAAQRNWPGDTQAVDLTPYAGEIAFEMFTQYAFYSQWMALKRYANEKGIGIIGDIPIYVGIDSLDVWDGRENFLLDEEGKATFVAGVPPDYFSAQGQRWGNPLYDWAHMEADDFSFWIRRLRYSAQLFDVVRIDHFRGFDTYWEIPAALPTAEHGVWREAPGYKLFDKVMQALPDIRIIAEDLGMLREEVHALRDAYHFRGMKILQFTYDATKRQKPRADRARMVAYTGTHDNQTTRGWYQAHPTGWRLKARWNLRRAGCRGSTMTRRFIALALEDAADIAIIPMADIMGLDDRARINTPGTVGTPNWEWKLRDLRRAGAGLRWFEKAVRHSGRT